MCNWQEKEFPYARGKIKIAAHTLQAACEVIFQASQKSPLTITYTEVMNELKALGCPKINRGTIGDIVGEISVQVSEATKQHSIYPSAIVVRRDTKQPGDGFWGVRAGTNPPSRVPRNGRRDALRQYQNDVLKRPWACKC
jgi:hypothetical protein